MTNGTNKKRADQKEGEGCGLSDPEESRGEGYMHGSCGKCDGRRSTSAGASDNAFARMARMFSHPRNIFAYISEETASCGAVLCVLHREKNKGDETVNEDGDS